MFIHKKFKKPNNKKENYMEAQDQTQDPAETKVATGAQVTGVDMAATKTETDPNAPSGEQSNTANVGASISGSQAVSSADTTQAATQGQVDPNATGNLSGSSANSVDSAANTGRIASGQIAASNALTPVKPGSAAHHELIKEKACWLVRELEKLGEEISGEWLTIKNKIEDII